MKASRTNNDMSRDRNEDRTAWWHVAVWLFVGIALASLVAHRVLPDDRLIVRMVRGLMAGGLLAGALGALLAAIGVALARRRAWLPAAVAGFAAGFLINAVATWCLALNFDQPLMRAVERARTGTDFVELRTADGATHWISRTSIGTYRHVRPQAEIPSLAIDIAVALEDRRYFDRAGILDPHAIARAVLDLRRGRLEGTSGLSAQLAGRLLNIDTRSGSVLTRAGHKAAKMLAGERLDDLLPRHEIAELYLRTATFGTVAGHEIVGLPEAASIYYGKEVGTLSVEDLGELIGRLPNPTVFAPLRSPSESDIHWTRRLSRIEGNYAAVIGRLTALGLRRAGAPAKIVAIDYQRVIATVAVPRLSAIFNELAAQNVSVDIPIRVRTAFRPDVQAELAAASVEGLAQLQQRIPWQRHPDDRVVVDGTVIDAAGGIMAELGLATVRGGSSSIEKPTVYGLALELGVLPSMASIVDGRSAYDGLVHSDNDTAKGVAHLVGLHTVSRVLEREGGHPTGAFESIVLGAGVTTSPRIVAGRFAEWADWSLGVRLVPSLLTEVTDRRTGRVLFTPLHDRMFSANTARQIQAALVEVSRSGTGSVMRPLSMLVPVLMKTGSAGFLKNGRWVGEGGSYAAGCDTATKVCFGIRLRWASGSPFELSAGQSAAVVAARLIARIRQLGGE